jgi:hypothetical protein
MYFAKLVELDSRVGDLMKAAQAVKRVKGAPFCANEVWYGRSLRSKLQALVGNCR